MTDANRIPDAIRRHLRRPLLLTRAGMMAERLTQAFWPFWSIALALLAALMLGLPGAVVLELAWLGGVLAVAGLVATLVLGLRSFRWPSEAEALDRLDRSLPGRPITALADDVAVGASDSGSHALWEAHLRRMAHRAEAARATDPDLRISHRDPYAMRYVAVLAFAMAVMFGSVWRVADVGEIAPGGGQALAAGPVWEGWVEPPAYTGKPSLYLADLDRDAVTVPEGSRVTLRFYGEVGALRVEETVSGRGAEASEAEATDPAQSFDVIHPGRLEIAGPGGRGWDVAVEPDLTPQVAVAGEMQRAPGGETRIPFEASDDYGVMAGKATIRLDLEAVDRRHGLSVPPEPREPIVVDLPMPLSGDRTGFEEALIGNFSEHPWANMPVVLEFEVIDSPGQVGRSDAANENLGGRRFFDPLAQAIIEQRRDLLWNRANAPRVARVLRAVSWQPEQGMFPSETLYLRFRVAIRRLEAGMDVTGLSQGRQEEIAQVLWDIANNIEFGDLDDARERLERARERLNEAMRNGASDAEIAELMQELREAMQDYMRQLAENAQREGEDQQQAQGEMQEITGDQLQEMLDRIQELMEQGRMEEAQRLLDQLARMMENMQVAQGEGGQGQQGEGQQAMRDLNETLRGQQNLSDDSFRDLQEQFGEGQQGGQGSRGQQGRQPGEQGQFGEGQEPGAGEGQEPGAGGGQQGDGAGGLAERQRALRDELSRQRQNLPGAGTEEGDAARDSLGRAEEAMDGAEQALRDNDIPGALDRQAEAMEALRDGIRNLGEALAQNQQDQGGQGQAAQDGQAPEGNRRDPLGRTAGADGRIGTEEQLLQGEDVYRRAEELLDEIQRRSGERDRPQLELEYLERLLDRF